MSSENKTVVVAKDGNAVVTVLEGKRVVELKDLTQIKFKTTYFESFVDYVKNLPVTLPIFCDMENCKLAVFNLELDIDRNTIPMAELSYTQSTVLQRVMQIFNMGNGVTMDVDKAEIALKQLMAYGDAEVIRLYEFCRNVVISADIEIRRQVDDDGNVDVLFSRKSKGEKKIRPVERVAFEVPLVESNDTRVRISFDVALSYDTDNGVKISLTFTSFTVQEVIKKAVTQLVNSYIDGGGPANRPKYFGTMEIIQKTDEWKYLVK